MDPFTQLPKSFSVNNSIFTLILSLCLDEDGKLLDQCCLDEEYPPLLDQFVAVIRFFLNPLKAGGGSESMLCL